MRTLRPILLTLGFLLSGAITSARADMGGPITPIRYNLSRATPAQGIALTLIIITVGLALVRCRQALKRDRAGKLIPWRRYFVEMVAVAGLAALLAFGPPEDDGHPRNRGKSRNLGERTERSLALTFLFGLPVLMIETALASRRALGWLGLASAALGVGMRALPTEVIPPGGLQGAYRRLGIGDWILLPPEHADAAEQYRRIGLRVEIEGQLSGGHALGEPRQGRSPDLFAQFAWGRTEEEEQPLEHPFWWLGPK
jgi:hypothetical protein